MDQPVTLEVLLYVLGLATAAFGGSVLFSARSRAAMYKQLTQLSVKVAEVYATKDDLKDMERRLTERLERIDAKLDAVNGRARR